MPLFQRNATPTALRLRRLPPSASESVAPVSSASAYAPDTNASNHDGENGGERNDEAEDGDEEAEARALGVLDMGRRVGRVLARPRLPPRNLRLSTRPEVATPLTSIRRLGEGYWLKQSVMSLPTQILVQRLVYRGSPHL